jgi:UDP-3-O-[3-hydroxymyristoyl] N-acetylglucosamine deacetylase/3-hydroxyacyl-[acyl-carrier-protein] dehydratase
MSEKQRTLKSEISISGVGLHTGEKVNVTICPAPANHGYKFQRIDLPEQTIINADADLVVATDRGTTLEYKGARVYTTEHILAAIYGCQIDNALIKIDAPEIPIMDGSASAFVKEIEKVGIEAQDAKKIYISIDTNISYTDDEKNVEMVATPSTEYKITTMIDFNSKPMISAIDTLSQ